MIRQDRVYQYDTLLVKIMAIKIIQHHLFGNDDLRYTSLVEVNQANCSLVVLDTSWSQLQWIFECIEDIHPCIQLEKKEIHHCYPSITVHPSPILAQTMLLNFTLPKALDHKKPAVIIFMLTGASVDEQPDADGKGKVQGCHTPWDCWVSAHLLYCHLIEQVP